MFVNTINYTCIQFAISKELQSIITVIGNKILDLLLN